MSNRFRFHGGHLVSDALPDDIDRQNRGYREQPGPPEQIGGDGHDAQIPRGRLVLSLPADRFTIEQDGGEYHVYDFGQAADPHADPTSQAIARFEAGLAEAGSTLKKHGEVPVYHGADGARDSTRIRALQSMNDTHDWTKHGRS